MARQNYGFEKRQKELAKKQKKEEKRKRKLERTEDEVVEGSSDAQGADAQEFSDPPVDP